jgi:peptidoglycan hydrolase-like protein with peptidoglycan-binding domain
VGLLVAAVTWLTVRVEALTDRDETASARRPSTVVGVAVELRRLIGREHRPCRVEAAWTRELTLGVSPSVASDPVVTRAPTKRVTAVVDGQVLVEVSGRPVFVLSGGLPPYRDLSLGDDGPDVAELQEALHRLGYLAGIRRRGSLDQQTASAIAALYEDHGYRTPAGAQPTGEDRGEPDSDSSAEPVVWPRQERAVVPAGATVDLRAFSVGSSTDGQVATVRSSKKVLTCEVTAEDGPALRQGPNSMLAGGRRYGVTLARVSSGRAVFDMAPAVARAAGRAGATQLELTLADSRVKVLAVPVSAVWTDADGSSVVERQGRPGRPPGRVSVELGLTVEGLVEVRPGRAGALEPGDRVIVSSDHG